MNTQTINNKEVYNIGDVCIMINPKEDAPKVFKTHKVDNDFGVVYYYKLNGVEETIGFAYIKKIGGNKIKIKICVSALIILFYYLLLSVTIWDLNLSHWDEDVRGFFAATAPFLAILYVLFYDIKH
jgi:hypothetical protein